MESQHPVLTNLRRQIELLELDNVTLRNERDRLYSDHERDVEFVRSILIEAIKDGEDLGIVANSIADVLGISLLKEIVVSIPLTIEATMLVPVDFDIDDLQIHDVGCDVYNSDVDDFTVQSWDVGDIEEM